VRVPVAVTEDDDVTVLVEVFELLMLPVDVTVDEVVLDVVELCVIVRLARGLLDTSGVLVRIPLIVLVFDPRPERVKVGDALDVLER
jgi:hypothetical protein